MARSGSKSSIKFIAVTFLACLVLLTMVAPAAAYVPAGAPDVEEAEDLMGIWFFHGDEELEKFEIADNDVRGYKPGFEDFEIRFKGEIYPDGKLDLSKVITYRAIQAAVSQLWPEDVPVREEFEVTCADPSKHTEGIFEYITRATSRDAFELDAPRGTSEKNLILENYTYNFVNTDTGDEFETHVVEGVFPDGFFEMREKVMSGEATEYEENRFDTQWEEVTDKFLTTEEPGDLFEIEEEEEDPTPAWPIIFTFGLLGLVTTTTIYSFVRGRVS